MSQSLVPLVNKSFEPIAWSSATDKFHYPNMVRIRTIMDGSCFFHALLNGYLVSYRSGVVDGHAYSRREFVVALRHSLAHRLAEPWDPTDPNSPIVYDYLSRSKLREFGQSIPDYSLSNLQARLANPAHFADEAFLELVSNELGKDIYILDGFERDVYYLGHDTDLFYKHRNSVVLLYIHEHFEVVGVARPPEGQSTVDFSDSRNRPFIDTHFDPNHPFIAAIRARMEAKASAAEEAPVVG